MLNILKIVGMRIVEYANQSVSHLVRMPSFESVPAFVRVETHGLLIISLRRGVDIKLKYEWRIFY